MSNGVVAVLFADPIGIYSKIQDIEIWCKDRDGRLYADNKRVVAHPPCQLWGKFAKINFARWGGEHNRPGNDGGCFESALASVKRCGGVLEHPADSYAWSRYALVRPAGIGWIVAGEREWVCEVWQSAYGHPARKRTWLFYSGQNPPPKLNWDRPQGTHQIGFHDQRGKAANKPTISGRAASATPMEFALALIKIAKESII